MKPLKSAIDPNDAGFRTNYRHNKGLVEEFRERVEDDGAEEASIRE